MDFILGVLSGTSFYLILMWLLPRFRRWRLSLCKHEWSDWYESGDLELERICRKCPKFERMETGKDTP